MSLHKLKCWPVYYNDILSGKKTFEIRKHDRDFKLGDAITLEEWDPDEGYTGESLNVEVTYIFKNYFAESPLADGYILMGIKLRDVLSYNFSRRSIMRSKSVAAEEGATKPVIRDTKESGTRADNQTINR